MRPACLVNQNAGFGSSCPQALPAVIIQVFDHAQGQKVVSWEIRWKKKMCLKAWTTEKIYFRWSQCLQLFIWYIMFFFLSSAVDVPYDSDEEADYSKMDLVCDKLIASSSFFL